MSENNKKVIDEKVVEMKFDNRDFEKNTKQTMSTLDKLKEKLNLTGASKGLQDIGEKTKNISFEGMNKGIDTVNAKFSSMDIIGATVLNNLTNRAIQAGERMVKSLSLEAIKGGYDEYELMLNTVQTTMRATGKDMKTVETELQKLDTYADRTVYSTKDMLSNLPKFTNAGVELEKATQAMIGIANMTADAGYGADKASIAFYNLGQAISVGYLSRIDYKSIQNAGIDTLEFKNQMIDAAIQMGTLKKVGDNLYQSGKKQYTLQNLFIEGLQTQWATTDVMMKVFQDYGNEETEIGERAYKAATQVRDFHAMMENLKATAGTGWKTTWELLFGNVNQATELWTSLTNVINKGISKIADARNKILGSALTKSFKNLLTDVNKATDGIKTAVKEVADYGKLVDEIIIGKWGNGAKRVNLLTQARYEYAHAQNMVNEKLGCGVRLESKYEESLKDTSKTNTKINEENKEQINELLEQLLLMSDAELKAKGYTDEQIKSFKELNRVIKKTGIPMKEFIKNIDVIDGRWLLLNSLKNIGQGLINIFKGIGKAWSDIFKPLTGDTIFDAIASFHKFSLSIRDNEKIADKLSRTFRGVFAAIDLVKDILVGPLKFGIKIINKVLKLFGLSILDVTAFLGDVITNFHNFVENLIDGSSIIKITVDAIKKLVEAIKKFINAIKETKVYKEFINNINKAKEEFNKFTESIKETEAFKKLNEWLTESKKNFDKWLEGLKKSDNIVKYIFEGLSNGIREGGKYCINLIIEFAKNLLNSIKKVLGIHSPSTEFFEVGKNMMLGLMNGIKDTSDIVVNVIKEVGNKLIEIIKSLNLGSLATIAIGTGIGVGINKIGKAMSILAAPFASLNGVFYEFSMIEKTFRKKLKVFGNSMAIKAICDGLKSLAIAIAILAGSCILLANVPEDKLWTSVKVIGSLAAMLAALIVIAKISNKGNALSGKIEDISFGKMILVIISLATSMSIMTKALKNISDIPEDRLISSITAMSTIIAALVYLALGISKANLSDSVDIKGLNKFLLSFGALIFIMTLSIKKLGKMDRNELIQGGVTILAMGGFILSLLTLTRIITKIKGGKNVVSLAYVLKSMATLILSMAVTIKLLGKMDPSDIRKALFAIGGMALIITGLIAATNLFRLGKHSHDTKGLGSTLFGMASSILVMGVVIKLLGRMDPTDIWKAIFAIGGMSLIIAALIEFTNLAGDSKELTKIGKTIFMLSSSILTLSASAVILGMIPEENLKRGIIAVLGLCAGMALMIRQLRNANNIMGTIIALATSLGILAVSLGLLSMIDTGKLLGTSAAISLVMGALALLIHSTKVLQNVKSGVVAIIGYIAIIVALGLLLKELAKLSPENVLSTALGLSVLMLALGETVKIMQKSSIGANWKSMLIGVTGLLAIAGVMLLVVQSLKQLSGIDNVIPNAIALGALMSVLAIVNILVAVCGTIYAATGGIALLGLVGMVSIIGMLFMIVAALKQMDELKNASENIDALCKFISVLTIALVSLSLVSPLLVLASVALIGIISVIGIVGLLAVQLGALTTKFPKIETFINKGAPLMIKLSSCLGEMIGALIAGISTQLSSALPKIGKDLSDFMLGATPFIVMSKQVDKKVLEGSSILTASLLELTAAEFINGITKLISGGESFSKLGIELSNFMVNAMPFIIMSKNINPESMYGIKALSEAILIITGSNILEHATAWLTGGHSLEDFGNQLGGLGTSLNKFITNVGTFGDDQISTAESAARVIKVMAEAAKDIPKEGGLVGSIMGENDIENFGNKLGSLGTGLNNFVSNLGDFKDSSLDKVSIASEAIKKLGDVAKDLPNNGGWIGAICGDNDIATFAGELPSVGEGLTGFINKINGINSEGTSDKVNTAVDTIKKLGDASKYIKDNSIDNWDKFLGKEGLAGFAGNLPNIGSNISDFIGKAQNIDDNNKNRMFEILRTLFDFISMPWFNNKGGELRDVGDGVKKLGNGIEACMKALYKIKGGDWRSSLNRLSEMFDVFNKIGNINSDEITNKSNQIIGALQSLGTQATLKITEELFPSGMSSGYLAEALMTYLEEGIKVVNEYNIKFSDSMQKLVDSILEIIESQSLEDRFYESGKNLIKGFSNGMENNYSIVTKVTSKIGELALSSLNNSLKEKSPSKLTAKSGRYFVEGFTLGIDKYKNSVYDSTYSIGTSAINGLNKAVYLASDLLDYGINTDPTIKPILDLSDVEEKSSELNNLIDTNSNIGLKANLDSISYNTSENQNGNNYDIIDAINKLKDDIGSTNNTYNINGITYDDGSNINDAVRTLVRAANIERRK